MHGRNLEWIFSHDSILSPCVSHKKLLFSLKISSNLSGETALLTTRFRRYNNYIFPTNVVVCDKYYVCLSLYETSCEKCIILEIVQKIRAGIFSCSDWTWCHSKHLTWLKFALFVHKMGAFIYFERNSPFSHAQYVAKKSEQLVAHFPYRIRWICLNNEKINQNEVPDLHPKHVVQNWK